MSKRSNARQRPSDAQYDTGISSHHTSSQIFSSKTNSHTSHRGNYKQHTSAMDTAGIQLLLFVIMLSAAYACNPKLDVLFLVACGAALVVLLVLRVWAAPKQARDALPPARYSPQQSPQSKAVHPRTPNLTGIWIKDKAVSDNMEPTLQLMRVNRLIRTAVGLVKGMELRQSDNSFEMIVLSGILWFKIREQYPLSGEVQRYKRRDLRKGLHRGTAEQLPDGAVCITLEWDEPLGGIGTDVFYVPAPGLLYVDSTIVMNGKTVKYRTIYNKQ